MFKKYQLVILFALLLVTFIGVNITVSLLFAPAVLDTTPNGQYSLRDKTRSWLKNNKSNIYMRLYVSDNYKKYASDVLRLLEQYKSASEGKISIKIIDTKPLTAAEAEAVKLGIQEIENKNYIGLVVSDERGNFATIPYLNPLRMFYLEHDISRLLSRLNNKNKKTIGVLSSEIKLTATESALDYTTDWPFLDILRNDYNIKSIRNRVPYVSDDIDVLLIVNPKYLPEETVYAIDQYLMRGGNILMFLDPVSEVAIAEKQYKPAFTSLEKFLKNLGVEYDYTKVVADRKNNRMITKSDGTKTFYPFWINIEDNKNDLIVGLKTILLNSSGYLKLSPQNGLSTQILLSTSQNSGIGKTKNVVFGSVNESINDITNVSDNLSVGVLLKGKFSSAYIAPIYENELYLTGKYAYQSIRLSDGKVAIVADSDLLNSKLWNANSDSDQKWYDAVPYSNNFDFIEVLVDYLSDSNLLSVEPIYTLYNTKSLDVEFMNWVKKKYSYDTIKLEKDILDIKDQQNKLAEQIKKKEVIMSVSVMQNMQNLEKKRIDLAYELKQKQKKQEYILSLAWLVFVTINILLPLLFLLLVVFIYKHNCKKLQIKAERIVNECR
ncbi:MAG: hypothetical protein E7019_04290 [Alphaproteobacteria bacterium]|nr:hypothetical protein [Alphaproteobacteria bacterium]